MWWTRRPSACVTMAGLATVARRSFLILTDWSSERTTLTESESESESEGGTGREAGETEQGERNRERGTERERGRNERVCVRENLKAEQQQHSEGSASPPCPPSLWPSRSRNCSVESRKLHCDEPAVTNASLVTSSACLSRMIRSAGPQSLNSVGACSRRHVAPAGVPN